MYRISVLVQRRSTIVSIRSYLLYWQLMVRECHHGICRCASASWALVPKLLARGHDTRHLYDFEVRPFDGREFAEYWRVRPPIVGITADVPVGAVVSHHHAVRLQRLQNGLRFGAEVGRY